MPGTSPQGWPYILDDDHPLEYPPYSQSLATLMDSRAVLRAVQTVKAANTAGLASGAASPHTVTMSGLRVGQQVLVYVQNHFVLQTGAVPTSGFMGHASMVGLTPSPTPGGSQVTVSALNIAAQLSALWLFTATAASVTCGYSMTFSNAGTWTAFAGTSLTIIAHG